MTDLDFDTALEDGAVRPGSHFAQRASADADAARALAGAVLDRLPLGAADGEDDAAWAALGLSDQAEESIELLGGDFDVPAITAAEMIESDGYDAEAWAPTAPQAVIAPRNRGWMWGVAATFLLGVGAFAAFFALPDDDEGERFLTPASVASAPAAGLASAAPASAARAPATMAVMSAASAAGAPESVAPRSAAAAAASAAPTPKATRSARRTPVRRRTATARKPAAAEDKPVAAPSTAAPAKRPSKAVAEVDSLLGGLGGGGKPTKAAPGRPAASVLDDPSLPEKLSKSQILRVVRTNAGKISSCKRGGATGTVKVVMVIGRSGRVTSATPGGAFAGTPAGVCVAAKVRAFRFPQFSGDPMRINMPFRL